MDKNLTKVAVLMGSDSDLPVMQCCIDLLNKFEIPYSVNVISAHRTPDLAAEFADNARSRGVKVIIAAAGMAAHLAGSIAARTTLPVIGVPMNADAGLGGMDALLSTVQMPPGIPVATVAIGKPGAKNAAILALQILALSDENMHEKLVRFRREQTEKVLQKNDMLQK